MLQTKRLNATSIIVVRKSIKIFPFYQGPFFMVTSISGFVFCLFGPFLGGVNIIPLVWAIACN